ncbi:MAG: hypothetical protein LBQ57_00125 [Spirochaetales bacterium]|jgi:hypothetical protein|nr:hypothetical protein [Spirochaetales bacterium]
MMKSFFAIAGLFFLAAGLSAQPAPRPLPAELVERLRLMHGFSAGDCEALRATGGVTRFQDEDFSSLMLPDKPLARSLMADLKALSATILVEALYVIPVEKGLPAKADFRLSLYNTLHKIDTMKGLQYWSASGQRMQTMFNDAYVIAGPKSSAPLPNPVAREIPSQKTIYVFQDDARFGKNTYTADYRYNAGRFWVSMKNLTRMYYGIIPMVSPEKLRLDMIILPGDDYLIFYCCMSADVFTLFGMEKQALPSFSNRINALFTWFLENMREI